MQSSSLTGKTSLLLKNSMMFTSLMRSAASCTLPVLSNLGSPMCGSCTDEAENEGSCTDDGNVTEGSSNLLPFRLDRSMEGRETGICF